MRKKISIMVCDKCEDEVTREDRYYKCMICQKDLCEGCTFRISDDDDGFAEVVFGIKRSTRFCEDCMNPNVVKRFFKQNEVKEKMHKTFEELMDYLKKNIMLKNLEAN